jgi:hypothetical protein
MRVQDVMTTGVMTTGVKTIGPTVSAERPFVDRLHDAEKDDQQRRWHYRVRRGQDHQWLSAC